MRTKLKVAKNRDDYFFQKFDCWLNTKVSFLVEAKSKRLSTGRPQEEFDQLSDRSKRRTTKDIRSKYGTAELSYAAQMSLRSSEKLDAPVVVRDISSSNPSKAKKYRKVANSSVLDNLDGNEGVALLCDIVLSRDKYQQLRNWALKKTATFSHRTRGRKINIKKFREYTVETARYFVKEYPWYKIPPGVHRLLIHRPDIIDSALLQIGKLSEEAQESTNKLIRRYRENISRKYSRVKNLEDVFRRLLAATDPYVASLRKPPQKKLKSLLPDAIDLLLQPKTRTDEDEAVGNEVDDDEQDLIWDSDEAMSTEEEEGNV
ncbi:hypothetical protein ILUMI_03500 [Ignelater luminosus]|uniref:Endonuclease n=1 Tax=Ignelater luminosus TaxID=2038154 RepID=A0A8K0GKE3_IGNLU|nr:hypothetical protein ILUMI_03500 [Ignelater luminosus]